MGVSELDTSTVGVITAEVGLVSSQHRLLPSAYKIKEKNVVKN